MSICSQNSHRLFAMLLSSASLTFSVFGLKSYPKLKTKLRISMFYLRLYHFYGTKRAVKIKELLRNFKYYNLIIGSPDIRNF